MSFNVLVTADVHINQYNTYNPTENFRLNQFLKLADLMLKTIKENNCRELWIAGDLLVTPKADPEVMFVTKQFIETFSKEGIPVRIVLGNHDVTIKNRNTDISEYKRKTLITLLGNNEFIHVYESGVVRYLDINKSVFFQSWMPNNDIIYEDADVLVTHGDIDKNLSPFVGNYIDYSKYKRTLIGHIHKSLDTDSYNSIGTPIMHSFSDDPNTSLMVYDLENDTYNRVPTADQFLTFQYAEDDLEFDKLTAYYQAKGQDAVIKVKPQIFEDNTDISAQEEVTLKDLEISPVKVLKAFSSNLSEKAQKYLDDAIKSSDQLENAISTPDLRVHLKRLQAKNFLSIKKLDFNFEEYKGLTVLTGENGAGKSTLFNLILFMFLGSLPGRKKADYTAIFDKPFDGDLTFEYKGHQYEIWRDLSSLQFYKDGKAIDANRKADLQAYMDEELTFLWFLDLIFIPQASKGIFAEMSSTNRISFLSNLIGLDIITSWTDSVASSLDEIKSSISDKEAEIGKKEVQITDTEYYINENLEHDHFEDLTDLEALVKKDQETLESHHEEVSGLKSKKSEYKTEIKHINSLKKEREELLDDIKSDKDNLDSLNKDKESLEEEINQLIKDSEDQDKSTLEFINESLDEEYKSISSGRKVNVKTKLNLISKELGKLKNHPDICPTCGQKWIIPNLKELISSKETELSDIKQQESNIEKELSNITETIDNNSSILKILSKLSKKKDQLKNLNDKISDLRSSITKKEKKLIESPKDFDIKEYETKISNIDKQLEDLDVVYEELQSTLKQHTKDLGAAKINNEIYEKLQDSRERIEKTKKKIEILQKDIEETQEIYYELKDFNSKVLSDKGLLVANLLEKVAKQLNTDKMLKIETTEVLQNGSIRPTLNIKLFVKELKKKGVYVDYDYLSGGQKLMADLRFLACLTNALGSVSVLFMDELFKFSSDPMIIEGADIIKSMKVDQIFLTLHGELQQAISNSIISVTLDPVEKSKYTRI